MKRVYADKKPPAITRVKKDIMGAKEFHSQPSYYEETKKIKRVKSRNRTIKEIKKFQRGTELLIPKLPFRRIVREIAQTYNPSIRFTDSALIGLQEACESYIIGSIEDGILCTIHAKRITLMKKDIKLAQKIKGENHLH